MCIIAAIGDFVLDKVVETDDVIKGIRADWGQHSSEFIVAALSDRRLERSFAKLAAHPNANCPTKIRPIEESALLYVCAYARILELITRLHMR